MRETFPDNRDAYRLVWAVYKYFLENSHLLEEKMGREVFEIARKILLKKYAAELKDDDEEAVERAVMMAARFFRLDYSEFNSDEPTTV